MCLTTGGRTLLIHGYSDCLADPSYAMKMGKRLGAMCVMVPGAHLITRESVQEASILPFQVAIYLLTDFRYTVTVAVTFHVSNMPYYYISYMIYLSISRIT